MPDPNPPMIEFPSPATPCDEGIVYSPIITCNGEGQWVTDWVVADAGSFTAEERVVGFATLKARCGCGADPIALVRLGAELFQAGIEFGRK